MSNLTPTAANPVISAGGNFQINEKVLGADGKPTEQFVTLSFASLLIWAGLKSLETSRGAFNSQYEIASNKVKVMQDLNNLMQMMNTVKAKFTDGDGSAALKQMTSDEYADYKDFYKKYPELVAMLPIKTTETTSNNVTTTKYEVTKKDVEAFISNLQTAQSTLSSENEQQSMRTNQAMNRASGFLQQLQSVMQTAKEALQAATKAGAA